MFYTQLQLVHETHLRDGTVKLNHYQKHLYLYICLSVHLFVYLLKGLPVSHQTL